MQIISLTNLVIALESGLDSSVLNIVIKNRFGSKVKLISSEIKQFSDELLGYLAKHDLLTINIRKDDGKEKTETFFLKSTLEKANLPKDYFLTEYKFFSQENPLLSENIKVEPWTAKCYYADDKKLIFEDLRVKGFKTRKEKLSISDLTLGLKVIARFHATSIVVQKKLNFPLNNFYPEIFKEKNFVNYGLNLKWINTGMKAIEAIAKKLNYNPSLVRRAYALTMEKVQPKSDEINVLSHSDLWKNNLMFDDFGNCRLVDFQLASYSSIGIDLAVFICLNTDFEIREKYEKDFLKIYHEELEKWLRQNDLGSNLVTLEEIILAFEEKKICGLVLAVQNLPIQLMNKHYSDKFTGEFREYYAYTNRTDLIFDSMECDKKYGKIMNDIVLELVNYFKG